MWKFVFILALSLALASGQEEQVEEPCPLDCQDLPLDISFIVDASSSIWESNFTIGLWFVQNFVDAFDIGPDKVRVSMVTFADRVYDEDAFSFTANTNKESLDKAIAEMPYHAGLATETGLAIKWFLEHQQPEARKDVRSVVIVLTDGNSQRARVTKAEAAKALEKGLEVFAIGVGHSVSQEELHNIASSGDHVFVVNEYDALEDIQKRLAHETCGVKPQPICGFNPVDVAFVLDSSRSIGAENYTLELEFIKEFLDVFEINPSSVRVAAIMFGDRVYSEKAINFDQYDNKKNTLDAILALPYMQGKSTQTGAGIDYMIDNFVPKFRDHAAHIGIVITDGQSQKWRYTEEAAKRARKSGITTVAVGVGKVGDSLDQKELENIAGDPSRVITADNFAELNEIRDRLTEITCEGVEQHVKAHSLKH